MSNAPTLAKTPSNEKPVAGGVIFCRASGACGTQAAHGRDGEWSRVKRRAPIMAVVHMSLRQLTLLSCGGGIHGGGFIKEIDGARDWRETDNPREGYNHTSVRGKNIVIGCIFIECGLFVLHPLTGSRAFHIQSHERWSGVS